MRLDAGQPAHRCLEFFGFIRVGASNPDLPTDESAQIEVGLDPVLNLVVVKQDVVEAGLPRRAGALVITDAHPALVVDGYGAEKFAVLAVEEDGPPDLHFGRVEVGAEVLRGGLQDKRRHHLAVEHEDERQPAQAQALFRLDIVYAHRRIAGEGVERPDGRAEARHLMGVAPEGNRAELVRRLGVGRRHHHRGGEDDRVGALDDVRKGVVERGVIGIAVVEVHVEDDALRRVIDQAAERERVIEARPGPGVVGRDVVDGDERELVAGR